MRARLASLLKRVIGQSARSRGTPQFLVAGHTASASRQRVDLNRFISLALDTFAKLAGSTILVRSRLWAEPVTISAEVSDVERILLNLVLNARDAMPAGGVLTIETAVVIESSRADQSGSAFVKPRVRVRLTDTGCGMRPEHEGTHVRAVFHCQERRHRFGFRLDRVYGGASRRHSPGR